MSVLVTEGAGYVGSHIVWQLVDMDENVVVRDNLLTSFSWAVAPGATFVKGDCGDADQVARLIDEHVVDVIVHLAGSVVASDSVSDPLSYYRNNTAGACTLIEAAVDGGVCRHRPC